MVMEHSIRKCSREILRVLWEAFYEGKTDNNKNAMFLLMIGNNYYSI